MSGVHGVLRFDGAAVRLSDLERQSRALLRRGPDRQSTWYEHDIGLGHVLLRITREDMHDTQPIVRDNLALVADIRLDNRDELIAALKLPESGAAAVPDSEILFHAFCRWREDCVEHLVGDFVFAVWDAAARTLVLARDHMGQRPVYYHRGKTFFAFASDARGLWALPDIPQNLDMPTLAHRLAIDRAPSHGATIFENVFGLEGGTIMRVSAHGETSRRQYWTPRADPRHVGRNEDYYVKAYREVLGEAVACRVRRARQNPALLLGGGFDSGAIAGLVGAALAERGGKLIAIVSAESEDGRGARRWAEVLARHMKHLEVHYIGRDALDVLGGLEASFVKTGEPHSPNRYAVDALYAAAAAAGARVVMDGHGGDYTLNPRGTGWLARRLVRGEWGRFLSELRAHRKHTGRRFGNVIKTEVAAEILPGPIIQSWRRLRNGLPAFGPAAPIAPALLAHARKDLDLRAMARRREPAPLMAEVLRRQQSLAVKGGALLAASHGLEFAQPFHDKRVVELALAIPESLHVRGGRDRYLARIALADIYPPEFQARGSANDELIADFPEMAERIKSRLASEIDRLAKDEALASMFNFPKMSRMLGLGSGRPITKRNEAAARHAIRTLLYARYIEWFRPSNRPPS